MTQNGMSGRAVRWTRFGGGKPSTKWLADLAGQSSHRLLALSFLPLHASIWSADDPVLSKALFLVHIGLFLLWQPFVSRDAQLRTRPLLVALLALLGVLYLGGSLAQLAWVGLLCGVLASYRPGSGRDRLLFVLLLGFLLLELFGALVPNNLPPALAPQGDPRAVAWLALGLNLAALLLPGGAATLRNYAADALYALITVAVLAVLAMSTLLWMTLGGQDYYFALALSMVGLAAVLVLFNAVFRSSQDLGLLTQIADRYSLNVGTPLEAFLLEAAELSEGSDDPEEYLEKAFTALCKLDWVQGFRWRTRRGEGAVGRDAGYLHAFDFDGLMVSVYCNQPLGGALKDHAQLLLRLVEIFYTAKQRERSLARRAHMEAIYETGARLTHDIKNLLQSLSLMLSGAKARTMSPEETRLFIGNLEIIAQRLQQTLAKLRNPETLSEHRVSLHDWWKALQRREGNDGLRFEESLSEGLEIPEELFNSVAENLIDNARKKRRNHPGITITVRLHCGLDGLSLEVEDDGPAVPEAVARRLFEEPVRSRSGFGIGLYQCARQAAAHGYRLALEHNVDGRVCFALRKG